MLFHPFRKSSSIRFFHPPLVNHPEQPVPEGFPQMIHSVFQRIREHVRYEIIEKRHADVAFRSEMIAYIEIKFFCEIRRDRVFFMK